MVEVTLDSMARGGIYDQIGGGFHRYSTDARWLVPHFEKMLYDSALLVKLYLHAYQVTGKPLYRRIVEQTLDYVLREMTAGQGASTRRRTRTARAWRGSSSSGSRTRWSSFCGERKAT